MMIAVAFACALIGDVLMRWSAASAARGEGTPAPGWSIASFGCAWTAGAAAAARIMLLGREVDPNHEVLIASTVTAIGTVTTCWSIVLIEQARAALGKTTSIEDAIVKRLYPPDGKAWKAVDGEAALWRAAREAGAARRLHAVSLGAATGAASVWAAVAATAGSPGVAALPALAFGTWSGASWIAGVARETRENAQPKPASGDDDPPAPNDSKHDE